MKYTIFTLKSVVALATTYITATGSLPAQTIYNGSLELGIDPGPDFIGLSAPNSTAITGWTVANGTVDYIGGRWVAAAGSRSADMNGTTYAGTLTQDVSGFSVGQQYRLFFYMAASPDAPVGAVRNLEVDIGPISQVFTATGTHSDSSPGWSQRELDFTATDSTMLLSFKSLANGDWGPILDNISLVPVPEPGAISLTILGLGVVAFARRQQS